MFHLSLSCIRKNLSFILPSSCFCFCFHSLPNFLRFSVHFFTGILIMYDKNVCHIVTQYDSHQTNERQNNRIHCKVERGQRIRGICIMLLMPRGTGKQASNQKRIRWKDGNVLNGVYFPVSLFVEFVAFVVTFVCEYFELLVSFCCLWLLT